MDVRYLVRMVLDHGVVRSWTGDGELSVDEPFDPDGTAPGGTGTYAGDAALLATTGGAARFGLRGRALVGTPVVGRIIDVFCAGFRDAQNWRLLPFVRRGLIDNPTLRGGVYSFDVAPRVYRAPSREWSHEEQRRLRNDDFFFSQQRALAKGIEGIHFPDVPNFDPDDNYDTLAIQQPAGSANPGSADAGIGGTSSLSSPGVARAGGVRTVALPLPAFRGRQGA